MQSSFITTGTLIKEFIEHFSAQCEKKQRQSYLLLWILETTGAEDAATLKAEIDKEYSLLFHDSAVYKKLLEWKKEKKAKDFLLARQLELLIHKFTENQMPRTILEKIADKEANLSLTYAKFRPLFNNKPITQNDILKLLKESRDVEERKKVWEISKEVGDALAPEILELVNLRNQGAKHLGYPDYFQMQLKLQEVDKDWLFTTLEELCTTSQKGYDKALLEIEERQQELFHVSKEELGPWAWLEPFSQDDPLDAEALDSIYEKVDLVKMCKDFFSKMGFDVTKILERSDLYEREGKNQHAFCINIDRKEDIRTLNNVTPTIRWAEVLLHELGHAIYETGYDQKLPWLLREPPHMITTEAMALLCGRQVFLPIFIKEMTGLQDENILNKAFNRLRRRQLVFSRWVLVITHFEKELYANLNQDLNDLWWTLVEKYQKVKRPSNREGKCDWAAKYHIGLAPVYYYSYLLGEMQASGMQKKLQEISGNERIYTPEGKEYFTSKLFAPGNSYSWDKLIEKLLDEPLSSKAWVDEFAK